MDCRTFLLPKDDRENVVVRWVRAEVRLRLLVRC